MWLARIIGTTAAHGLGNDWANSMEPGPKSHLPPPCPWLFSSAVPWLLSWHSFDDEHRSIMTYAPTIGLLPTAADAGSCAR